MLQQRWEEAERVGRVAGEALGLKKAKLAAARKALRQAEALLEA